MKTWNFIAIFLDPASKQNIKKIFPALPSDWTLYGDHITLAFNGTPNPDAEVATLQCYGAFRFCKKYVCKAYVTAFAKTDKVCALRVKLDSLENLAAISGKTYHITIGTAPGVPPKESNNIPESAWQKIVSFPVFGKVGYRLHDRTYFKEPFMGRSARIWSALQGFDFPKGELMYACRQEGAPLTESQYYKAERAARTAFVNALTK